MEVRTAKMVLYITRGITVTLLLMFVAALAYKGINKKNDILAQTQEKCSSFIQSNITLLSPKSAVLGGTRYTTDIQYMTGSTTAIVNYEDGHIAETISIECSLENDAVKIGTITPLSSQ
ncbi:hypothetical protein KA037_04910 [Patescibacteria group bacterium]|jgi:hypothetical protein|nr:hypothetical protein [Patescibacteria group bacterium]MBP7841971.1 hypothetical protein [Patescibacteria group bacterium]